MTLRNLLIVCLFTSLAAGVAVWAAPPETPPAAPPALSPASPPKAPIAAPAPPAVRNVQAPVAVAPAAPAPQPAAAPPLPPRLAKPTTAVKLDTCTNVGCHENIKQYRAVHGPVNVNACDACHTLKDAKTHQFVLARSPQTLCTFCHEMDTKGAAVVHKPLTTGQCVACHNPHGGFDRHLLRSQSMQDLCQKCHGDITQKMKYKHGPVAAGACGACHQPHMSNNKYLLVRSGRDLCLSCHQEMGQQLKSVKYVHKAVEGDCTQCHDPHASNQPDMLHAAPFQLCTGCHKNIRLAVTEAKYKHAAVTEKSACTNCHTPHGSDLQDLMRDQMVKLCLQCHTKDYKTPDGRDVPPVTDLADPSLFKHGPARDGSCSGCHNVHGSSVSRLLAKPYPATFYAPFKLADYDLCFSCHNKDLVLLPKTTGLTNFRNGDENLHYVHVNKDVRGRTCRACHATHASTRANLIRNWVPFGSWKLPINYTATKTGGACAPGCHQPMRYDRVKAVPNHLAPTTNLTGSPNP